MQSVGSSYAPLAMRSVRMLIDGGFLTSHFQPIADLAEGTIYGHEALIRGPEGTPYAMPDALFSGSATEGCTYELEIECIRCALQAWQATAMVGRLFLNLSASSLVRAMAKARSVDQLLRHATDRGIAPASLVVELTEHELVKDAKALQVACAELRRFGVAIALDDFGDGRSSLRLWSEIKPEIVKIDKYFLKDICRHGDKLQTLRALQSIAETFGSRLVAEGLEGPDELRLARDIGISYGQGWILGRPQPEPVATALPEATEVLSSRHIAVLPGQKRVSNAGFTAARLLMPAPTVLPSATNSAVYELLREEDALHAIAIVDSERPVGLINRSQLIALYARPFFKELYGNKACTLFANLSPTLIDAHTGIEELTGVLTSGDQRYLTEGFIITEGGIYRGLGTGQQLVRAVTEARIEAARHANPLTLLPGNIPISDHISRLLASGGSFVAAYADLNHFKPYNDQYGYWRGDEMIRLAASILLTHCDPRRDFVGHVGGDDFVLLFQSSDWHARCLAIVDDFNTKALSLFDPVDRDAGGIHAEDRHGDMRFHPCTSLSLGIIQVFPGQFAHPEEVANAAAAAKREAKHSNLGVSVLVRER